MINRNIPTLQQNGHVNTHTHPWTHRTITTQGQDCRTGGCYRQCTKTTHWSSGGRAASRKETTGTGRGQVIIVVDFFFVFMYFYGHILRDFVPVRAKGWARLAVCGCRRFDAPHARMLPLPLLVMDFVLQLFRFFTTLHFRRGFLFQLTFGVLFLKLSQPFSTSVLIVYGSRSFFTRHCLALASSICIPC